MSHRLRTFRRRENRAPNTPGGSDYQNLADRMEDPHSDLSQAWDKEHDSYVLQQLIERVKSDTKSWEVFRRVALNQEPSAQVAASLGMTPNAVAIAKSKVLTQLRKLGEGLIDISVA